MADEKPVTAVAVAAPVGQLNDAQLFELAQREAKMLSSSTLVPEQFRGPNGIANCMIALNLAKRLGADALMVMQNLYVVHGRPGWSAKFLIATANQCGRFSPLTFEFVGTEGKPDRGCYAVATDLKTGKVLVGPTVTLAIAKAEGWLSKNGSKWLTIPELMFRYRAGGWWVNTFAPELSMGLPTAEELHDMQAQPVGAKWSPVDKGAAVAEIAGLKVIADPSVPRGALVPVADDEPEDVMLARKQMEAEERQRLEREREGK